MDEDAAENLVGQVTSLTITAVLDTPPKSLDDPLLEYTLELKSGERHRYRFFKDEDCAKNISGCLPSTWTAFATATVPAW